MKLYIEEDELKEMIQEILNKEFNDYLKTFYISGLKCEKITKQIINELRKKEGQQ